ncbi:unnamed protein product [Ectocarpus sp. 4 AP-2014]
MDKRVLPESRPGVEPPNSKIERLRPFFLERFRSTISGYTLRAVCSEKGGLEYASHGTTATTGTGFEPRPHTSDDTSISSSPHCFREPATSVSNTAIDHNNPSAKCVSGPSTNPRRTSRGLYTSGPAESTGKKTKTMTVLTQYDFFHHHHH